jgi:DNA invertase Pin-like site-specific DNA recombinase
LRPGAIQGVILDGYVRVSQVRGRKGESFISPGVQREGIERWAAAKGAQIGKVFEELDASGARADRPMLEEAISRVESGQSDGVIVNMLDRFGRSHLHGLLAIQRIRDAGGTFISVQDGFDLGTPTGRHMLRTMLSNAEWQLDHIRAGWEIARARATARGVHMGGRPPAGYVHDEARRLQPHPLHGPHITQLFADRAEGMTLERVAQRLTDAGVPSAYSANAWTVAGVRCVLSNRVYLGELRNGDHVLEEAHPPLTDPVTWQRAQSPRLRSGSSRGRPSVLGGLVYCGTCGHLMQSHSVVQRRRRRRAYACRRHECAARAYINGVVIEPYVEACFFALVERAVMPEELQALEAEAAAARAALVGFRDDPAVYDVLGQEEFVAGLGERMARQRRALGELAAARDRLWVLEPGDRDHWERQWPALSIIERRDAMSRAIEQVVVRRGAAAVQERVTVYPRGRGRPVDPPTAPTLWDEERIATELREYASDGWPPDEQFVTDGRGPLLAQVHASGGPVRWSRRVASQDAPRRARGYWTDERIRATLRTLMRDRTTWPTRRELSRVGYDGLYSAMDRRGRRAWEAEFGFADRPGLAGPTRWSEDNVRTALTVLCRGRDSYPSRAEFQLAGLDGLHQAVRAHHGGHDAWAERLGLVRAGGRAHRKTVARWTDALIESRLRALIADLELARYPLQREFVAAGEGGLYRRIKTTRGHAFWARRLDVPRPTARARAGGAA